MCKKKHIGRRKQRGGTLENCMAECTASCRARYPHNMRKPNKNGWYIETREHGYGYAPEIILCNTIFNPTFGTTNKCLNDTYVKFMDTLPPPTTTNADGYVATVINDKYYWTKDGHSDVPITKENADWNIMPKASSVTDADNDTDDPFGVSDEALAKFMNS